MILFSYVVIMSLLSYVITAIIHIVNDIKLNLCRCSVTQITILFQL